MIDIKEGNSPNAALTTEDGKLGSHTDCFYIDLPRAVNLDEYVYAFYTTRLFKVERAILSLIVRRPSTDEGALLLSQDKAQEFSAWTVERRTSDQILLRDFKGETKSWLMVQPTPVEPIPATRLYFGTVVVGKMSDDGQKSISYIFKLLDGFHRVYSKALLRAAYRALNS